MNSRNTLQRISHILYLLYSKRSVKNATGWWNQFHGLYYLGIRSLQVEYCLWNISDGMCWNTLLLHTASCTTPGRRLRSLETERENPRKKGVESVFLRATRLCSRIHAYACALRRDLCRRRYLSLRIEMSVMRCSATVPRT